ncbi:hypothetical protein A6E74_04620 [Enterococcus thailandicus]|uniref:Uncharacterized protein n=1 Tax=Enterococcus thailandicus TaxID=417368 RepID=A0A179ERZ0_ENTTH|nr:hypothetical protein A6E74_04620 [Enterococcus thailandicus]
MFDDQMRLADCEVPTKKGGTTFIRPLVITTKGFFFHQFLETRPLEVFSARKKQTEVEPRVNVLLASSQEGFFYLKEEKQ